MEVSKYEKEYSLAEQFIDFNKNDPDLDVIRVYLPRQPKSHLIDGYGLPPKEQFFKRHEIPNKLIELEHSCSTLEDIWDTIKNNYRYYKKEVEFIKKAWYHRLNGYWFYNNGIPTFIDGWHYFALNFWKYDIGYPEYRDRDRMFYIFARYCYTDTKTFKTLNKDDFAVPNSQGHYDMVDLKRRICYGFNYPKMRREGATFRAELINFEIISRTKNANGGIQSKDEESAKSAFEGKLLQPFKELPFFFKPEVENVMNKSMLKFSPSNKRLGKTNTFYRDLGLGSAIDYRSSTLKAYDGWKLYFKHDDEEGKSDGVDINKRFSIASKCMSTGNGHNIFGFTISTSTVGEMEADGGNAYYKMCKNSRWSKRDKNGQTANGKYNLFIPSYIGLEGYIDKYGNSVVDTPTKEQAEFIKDNIGAKEYLENKRNFLRRTEAFEELSENIRQYPTCFAECFLPSSKNQGFNIDKLQSRIGILRNQIHGNTALRQGDFERVDKSDPDSNVIFVDNKENGKFYLSVVLSNKESNKRHREFYNEKYVWFPDNKSKFSASGDCFMYNKTADNRKSDGAFTVFHKRDKMIDPDSKPMSEWETYRFACTYSNRTFDRDEYLEDCLMACQYYGCGIFPENNVDHIERYFTEKGYDGYLIYEFDYKTGRYKERAGISAQEGSKQKLFATTMTYIERNCFRENHDLLLEQWLKIKGIEEMTKYDLLASAGWNLVLEHDIKDPMNYEEEYNKLHQPVTENKSDFSVACRMY